MPNEVTVRHLTNTLDHIEEWIALVRGALETMNQDQPVPMKNIGLALPRGGRQQFGNVCKDIAVMPTGWRNDLENPAE